MFDGERLQTIWFYDIILYMRLYDDEDKKAKHDYYVQNKSRCLELKKLWRKTPSGIASEKRYKRKYYLDNKKKCLEQRKNWRGTHREHERGTAQLRYKERRQLGLITYATRKKKNSEEAKLYRRIMKHKRRVACGCMRDKNDFLKKFPLEIKKKLELQNYMCLYCGKDIRNDFTIDHIVPVCKGGNNDISNIDLICFSCNSSKGKKSKEEFIKYIEGVMAITKH
jgi:hypothetical protein